MIAEKHFKFQFNNVKKLWYLFFCFAGIPMLFVLNNHTPFFVFLLVILVPLIISFIFVVKKIKISEEITLLPDHLESSYYGRADFSEIDRISASIMFAQPNLTIRLKDGRKLRWVTTNNKAGDPDFDNLKGFLDAFSLAVIAYTYERTTAADSNTQTNIDSVLTADPRPASITSQKQSLDDADREHLQNDIKKVNNRNAQIGKIAIPVSLGVAIIGFFNYYIGPKITEHKNQGVREIFQRSREDNLDLKDKAAKFIKQYQHETGPFYLLTSDSSVQLFYLPEIIPPGDYEGPLSYVFESDSLRKLLEHPDSMRWNIILKSGGGDLYGIYKNILNTDDSTDTYIYCTEITPDIKKANPKFYSKELTPEQPDSIPIQLTFVVPLYPKSSIRENLENGMLGYKMFLSLFTHRSKTTKLYIAARQGEGRMDKALFNKVSAIIKQDLSKQGADTSLLARKQIN